MLECNVDAVVPLVVLGSLSLNGQRLMFFFT